MPRLIHRVIVAICVMVPVLPLVGGEPSKDKVDPFLAEMKFVKVPKGTFWMGRNRDLERTRTTGKQAEIKEDFEIAAYLVTQEQWQAVMGHNAAKFSRNSFNKDWVKDDSDADLKRFPIEGVSWNEVGTFLRRLNPRQKGTGWVYRLP